MPSFEELTTKFGPYLGLVLFVVLLYMIMQFVWFNKILKAKDKEITRLIDHEKELDRRLMSIIDRQIGYTGERPNPN